MGLRSQSKQMATWACSSSLIPCSYPFPKGDATLGDTHSVRRNSRVWIRAQADADSEKDAAFAGAQVRIPPKFTRRFTFGVLSAVSLAIGANFGGITSLLLGATPEAARSLRIDVLYPVGGFFRCLDIDRGFEFIYPQDWVGDQRILYRAVEKAEMERSLDLPALKQRQSKQRVVIEPVIAFGPPGTNGELNVSVIVAPIFPGFRIDTLGDAREAGDLILRKYIAPEGSNKTATLLDAQKREESLGNDQRMVYYTLNYTVKGPNFLRHNVTVYTASKGQLFSLNVQAPEAEWPSNKEQSTRIANSFKLIT